MDRLFWDYIHTYILYAGVNIERCSDDGSVIVVGGWMDGR